MYYIRLRIGKEEVCYNDIVNLQYKDKVLVFWYHGKLGSSEEVIFNLKEEKDFNLYISFKD